MCGRYTLYQTGELGERFGLIDDELAEIEDGLHARYNVAPSQAMPAITSDNDTRHLEMMRWGYIPHWAKDEHAVFKYKTFNARSEGIFDKPTWKNAIRHRRCLVPANGFYEWKATPTGKQPYYIHPRRQELFAFAGIYGSRRDHDGIEWNNYAIITTRPNLEMKNIHDRMPVILRQTEEDRWLDPMIDEPEDIVDMLRPYNNKELEIYEVSREVNASRIDSESFIMPLGSI